MTTEDEATPRERARRHTLRWVGTAIIVSLLLAALLMRSWTLFWIAVPLGVAYVMLLTMPVFLAIVTGSNAKENKS